MNDEQNYQQSSDQDASGTESQHTDSHQESKKGGIHNNALYAASMGRPATAQANHHSDASLAQTGTNTSYEGATAPGGGGSAGSGYTSGQSGVQTSITTDSDYDQTRSKKEGDGHKQEDSGNE